MSAYNVRHKKTIDGQPASGWRRTMHWVRELLVWLVGLAAMYGVYWLARRYLF